MSPTVNMKQHFVKNNFGQRGVTLLLALIILSAMLAISFSVSSILLVEVRSSGDLVRTEAAFYGGQGQIEEALYKTVRNVPDGSFTYSSQIGSVTLSAPVVSTSTDPIIQDKVLPGTNFSSANRYEFPASDPNHCSKSSPSACGSNYSKVTLTYVDTGNPNPLTVYLCDYNPLWPVDPSGQDPNSYKTAPCSSSDLSNTYWTQTATLYHNSPALNLNFISGNQQELVLYNAGSSNNIYIQLQPYDQNGVAKGLPYFGAQSVNVTANNSTVGRKIRVIIPNSAISSPVSVSGYAHHRQLTITGSVPSTQTNFPVLINIPSSDPVASSLKSAVTSAQGYDIMFAQNSDGSSPLNSEVESYNSSNGALVAWVNVPSLSNGVTFYMFYGKSGVSSPPNAPSAVWDSNYKAVYHLNQSPTGSAPQFTDSTGNGLNLTTTITSGSPALSTGQIGSGVNLPTASQYTGTHAISSANAGVGGGSFTISGWIKVNSFLTYDGYPQPELGIALDGASGCSRNWAAISLDSNNGFLFTTFNNCGNGASSTSHSSPVSAGSWNYFVGNSNGTTENFYMNGSLVASAAATTIADVPAFIENAQSESRYMDAQFDEFRLSNTIRSANWITTEYNNQSSPSGFYSFGAEQTP